MVWGGVWCGMQLSQDSPWAQKCLQDGLLIGTTTKSLDEIRAFNSQQVRNERDGWSACERACAGVRAEARVCICAERGGV